MDTNKWEEEFDEKFGIKGPEGDSDSIGRNAGCDDCRHNIELREEHKEFVRSTLEAYKKDLYSKLENMKKQHEKGFHICLEEDKVFVDADTGKKICIHRGIVEIHNKALSDAQELIQ